MKTPAAKRLLRFRRNRKTDFDAQMTATAEKLMQQAEAMPGDEVQKVIRLFNQTPPDSTVVAFLPMKKTPKDVLNAIRTLLDLREFPTGRPAASGWKKTNSPLRPI